MTPEEIRDRWSRRETTYGLWCALADPFAIELCSLASLDYLCVDQQHGLVDYRDLVNALPVIERHDVLPITRVADTSAIGKALDAGAMGVVVPMVSTAKQAADAVAQCRYAPDGLRSFGPIRAAVVRGASDPRLLEQVLCIVMVETVEGIANVAEIAGTPGVDAIYIGPADLGLSLGVPPVLEPTDDRHIDAINQIREACHEAGIGAGIQCSDGASALARAEEGFTMITVGKDTAFLQNAVKRELAAARGGGSTSTDRAYT